MQYWKKYPDTDFGEKPLKEYGDFLCGGLRTDGTQCPLMYGLRS